MPVPSQGHYGFHSFRLLTDFVCLYNYEFGLSLCKIVRSSVILLLPLLNITYSAIETKEVARIGYNGFLFPHEYSGEGRGAYITGFFFRMTTKVKAGVHSTKSGT